MIPIGEEDFKELRQSGFYFVDKSELISDILQNRNKVFLFTRPRRFGKSLNLSMLDAFFNLEYKGNTWFDGLKISNHPEAEEFKNAYPVIFMSMKDLNFLSLEGFMSSFGRRIRDLYISYRYLENSEKVDPARRADYQRIVSENTDEALLTDSLYVLCSMLFQHHGIKPIILLDEYDDTLNHAYGEESYNAILNVLRNFYSRTFKGNKFVTFSVLTGVMQIAKDGIFSGLNNLDVNNIFSTKFDETYGFTESEVKELCLYYGHPEKFDEAKEWYYGYRFGDAEIYNPWSIMKYLLEGFKPDTYWGGTSGNDIIDTLLRNADADTFNDLIALGNGEAVTKSLPESVVMNDLKTRANAIFSVLAVAGYLNAIPDGKEYVLSIPNREMYQIFYDHIVNYTFAGNDPFEKLLDSLETGDVAKVKHQLDVFYNNFSSLLLVNEGRYHVILATIYSDALGDTVSKSTGNPDAEHRISS